MKMTLSFIFITLGKATLVFAQGGPPGTPIDGGLGILLAAGAIYGIKKIRDNRRSN